MNRKRGQAALEFLTTYGWAFMVLLVMIAALSYFGVINPQTLLPDKCVFGAGIGCTDFVAYIDDPTESESTIRATLVNSLGHSVLIKEVSVECDGFETAGSCACNPPTENCNIGAVDSVWKSDSEKDFVLKLGVGALSSGSRPKIDVYIKYTKAGSTYPKQVDGLISIKNPQ